jgi:hypothetical protein
MHEGILPNLFCWIALNNGRTAPEGQRFASVWPGELQRTYGAMYALRKL